jgi:WhiB family redox-sensing transcriptional regulator
MSAQTMSTGVRTTETILALRPDLRRVLLLLGERGKCAGSPTPQAWYAPVHGYFTARDRARRLCEGCPVLEACRNYALEAGEEYGVWGGLCEVDRAQLRQGSTARERDLLRTHGHLTLSPLEDAS